jgi:plasmid stabilization system protein ParE
MFMKNSYRLLWSDEALSNLREIINYLENRWTHKEIGKFANLLEHQLKLIVSNPLLFPMVDKSLDLRKAVLSRQTTIFYRVKGFEIHILSLFDNRQNPAKLRI